MERRAVFLAGEHDGEIRHDERVHVPCGHAHHAAHLRELRVEDDRVESEVDLRAGRVRAAAGHGKRARGKVDPGPDAHVESVQSEIYGVRPVLEGRLKAGHVACRSQYLGTLHFTMGVMTMLR